MSESCKPSACSSCASAGSCGDQKPETTFENLQAGSSIKKVIGVVSGKGGVGKSLVTTLLAAATQRSGRKTAILDADVTGPSIPKAFGINERARCDNAGLIPAKSKSGISIMSANMILENETDPLIWRGPVIAGAVKQFWTDVNWGELDFMFIDMPPGTGDVALTVFKSIPLDGIVVVASAQELVGMIVEKALNMANMMNIPVLALVENMSGFKCPDCGSVHNVFGESHADEIAAKYNIDTVVKIPINPEIAKSVDKGDIESVKDENITTLVEKIINMENQQ